jgi:DNA-binding Xre family transcriptional regulator
MQTVEILDTRGKISQALAQIRTQGGPDLDIPALAAEARVPAEWLWQLDQGEPIQIEILDLARLCCVLGHSPNDLLGYEPDL